MPDKIKFLEIRENDIYVFKVEEKIVPCTKAFLENAVEYKSYRISKNTTPEELEKQLEIILKEFKPRSIEWIKIQDTENEFVLEINRGGK